MTAQYTITKRDLRWFVMLRLSFFRSYPAEPESLSNEVKRSERSELLPRQFHPYRLYSSAISIIRTNKSLFRQLYGFAAPEAKWGQYWDWTTVVLIHAIKRHLPPDADFLDLGCGPYAVLARHVQLRYQCNSVTAADHCAELLDYAKANDPKSGIRYLHSDLFSGMEGDFDLIAFNAPYIDTEKGKARGLFPDTLSQKRFCGGKEGVETIRRFLMELPRHLKAEGKVLLGVNHYHIADAVMQASLWQSEYKCIDIMYNQINKSCVYVLKRRNGAAV